MDFNSCIKIPGTKTDNKTAILKQEESSNTILFNKLINIANKYFGEQNWSHSVTNQQVDYLDKVNQKETVGCMTFVKVQLKNGIFHEEGTYYLAEDSLKSLAIFKARNVSIINALKKCLMCFGSEICLEICETEDQMNKKSTDVKSSKSNIPEQNITIKKENSQNPKVESTSKLTSIIPSSSLDKIMESDFILDISNIENKEPITLPKAQETPKSPMITKPVVKTKVPTASKAVEVNNKRSIETMTAEEERQERKRRQKEKQEEYRKMFQQKQSKEN